MFIGFFSPPNSPKLYSARLRTLQSLKPPPYRWPGTRRAASFLWLSLLGSITKKIFKIRAFMPLVVPKKGHAPGQRSFSEQQKNVKTTDKTTSKSCRKQKAHSRRWFQTENGLRVKTQRVKTSENFSEESNLPRRFRRYPDILQNRLKVRSEKSSEISSANIFSSAKFSEVFALCAFTLWIFPIRHPNRHVPFRNRNSSKTSQLW